MNEVIIAGGIDVSCSLDISPIGPGDPEESGWSCQAGRWKLAAVCLTRAVLALHGDGNADIITTYHSHKCSLCNRKTRLATTVLEIRS